ncbi:cyclopropane-fatty-acyl-phospholipid synthase [Nocardioides scoriae]|uniref:Cyclopropane-fatty-acyl-phospholipid synthase n=1 Tax=Nocardioides scoriae TaxID=642780 RepID=A0A1H1T0L9_9ACTN|nr:cyclopropane-fatty-acyl-phospholipid synthase family protein [Nocardioides scoriae]SDS53526.1 cyclopropane-fatty-acyl-phospholipid synthase [Nocardioides scoriae]
MTTTPARSATRWPGLDTVPSGVRTEVSARIARKIFHAAVRRLPVTVRDGAEVVGLGGPEMVVHRPDEFYRRVGSDGLIGFGEAYLTGAWDAEDLGGFLTVLAAEMPRLVPGWMQKLRAVYVKRPPSMHRNTTDNTRDNIAHHYDLSNDLFRVFLDETLSYSSALFDTSLTRVVADGRRHLVATPPEGGAEDGGEPLAQAQARKVERLLDQAGVTEGTRVLEIGTGWGELAIRAARRGATVHSVTLSREQLELAEQRVAAAGYADQVDIALCDYRLVEGEFDAVVSVEMIEAVGHEYWSTYFQTIDRLLAPGGRVGIQAITMPHDRMLATRHTYTWINKYIFPGGFLPSVRALEEVTAADTSLRISDRLSFGTHYADTLERWDLAFREAHEQVAALGFDATFERMWHFYLEYSRAGFASGYLDVQQLTFERTRA